MKNSNGLNWSTGPHNLYTNTEHIHKNELGYREFFKLYLRLLDAFIEEVITVGAQFYAGSWVIKVVKIDRWECYEEYKFRDRAINWPESFKLKKQLIEEGVPIRTKDNPNGQNWLVPFDTDYYYKIAAFMPRHCEPTVPGKLGHRILHRGIKFYSLFLTPSSYLKAKIKKYIADPTHHIHHTTSYSTYFYDENLVQGF